MEAEATKQLAASGKRKPPAAGKGRPKGSKNKLTADVKKAILAAFDKAGGAEYLTRVAQEDPRTFCTLLGKVLPMQVTGEDGGPLAIQVIRRTIVDSAGD